MILLATFLTNVLCATFNCDFTNPMPQIDRDSSISRRNLDLDGNISRPEPFVTTKSGSLEGYFMTLLNGREIYAFEGIYYGQPPRRFRAPEPVIPWEGVRQAKTPGPDCLQLSLTRLFRIIGRENCLSLNIYTPQIPTEGTSNSKGFPVILFLHGGNFYFGAGAEYGPSYLLQEEDVILVTVNYRLGVLGFLSTGDENSLGNWALRDQSLAIKWVHDNIAAFGGDSSNIILSGQSAGAVGVHLQMLSTNSVSRGLFTKAIGLSGSAFHRWGLQSPDYARLMTESLAKAVGCPVNKRLIKCLQQVDANFLVGAQRQMHVTSLFPLMLFGPVIEPNVTEAFIVDTAENYYKNDLVMKIPFICTNTAQESSFIFMGLDDINMSNYYIRNWRPLVAFLYDYGRFVDDPKAATTHLANAYFGSENVRENGLLMDRKTLREWGSDSYFTVSNRKVLRAHSKIAPTYSYKYEFRSDAGVASSVFHDYRKWEATHGEDLASLLNSTLLFKPIKKNSLHYEVSRVMINLIANFAKTGEPVYTGGEDGTPQKIWSPITKSSELTFLKIGEDASFEMVIDSPDKKRKLKAWEELGF